MGKKEKRIDTSFSDKDLRKELLRRSVPLLRPYWKQLCLATLPPKGRDRPRTLAKAEPCSLSSCVVGQRPIYTDAGPVRCVRRDYNDCAGGGAPGLLLHRGHG